MEQLQPRPISVVEPVGAAIEKTKEILFQPFDIGKWFVLGFVVWLATLWERGGGNFNFQMPFGQNQPQSVGPQMDPEFEQMMMQVKMFFVEHLSFFIAGGVVAFFVILTLIVLLAWLKSRFQFIFLQNITLNKLTIAAPWSKYAEQGNSLFVFKLIMGFVGTIISLAFLVPTGMIFHSFFQMNFESIDPVKAVIAGFLIFIFFLACIPLAIVSVITKDFIVPIMYIGKMKITLAWKYFYTLLRAHLGMFVLYWLFLILIAVVIGISFAIIFYAACCCFCFISWVFLIPIIGSYLLTVLTLPLWVWRRAYSALFLAQFGPEFDVFLNPDPVVVPGTVMPPTSPEQNF